MNFLAPPKRNLSGAWPENTNPLGHGNAVARKVSECYKGETARTDGRPAPEGAGDDGITRTDGGGGAQPGLHRAIPVRDQAADHGTDRSRWAQDAGPVPDGASDAGRTVSLHEAQDGAGELGRGPTAAPWNPTARSSPAAAATVETIAAADDKKRRAKTPGGVVKRAVAIDVQSFRRIISG